MFSTALFPIHCKGSKIVYLQRRGRIAIKLTFYNIKLYTSNLLQLKSF